VSWQDFLQNVLRLRAKSPLVDFEHPICPFLGLFADVVSFEKQIQSVSILWCKTKVPTTDYCFWKYGQKTH